MSGGSTDPIDEKLKLQNMLKFAVMLPVIYFQQITERTVWTERANI